VQTHFGVEGLNNAHYWQKLAVCPIVHIGLLAASDQAVKWLVQQSMAYGEYVSVTPFFNWCTYGTPVPHSVFCEWWRLAALLLSESR
jgi:hypothetical protein